MRSTIAFVPMIPLLLSCAAAQRPAGAEGAPATVWRATGRVGHTATWPVAPPSGDSSGWPDAWLATTSSATPWAVQEASCQEEFGTAATTCQVVVKPGAETPSLDALAGQPMTLGLRVAAGAFRRFHGYVVGAAHSPDGLSLTLATPPELLRRAAGAGLFHERAVPEIVAAVMARHPGISYAFELSRSYPAHEVFAQYRETDLNFLRRILEHVGILSYVRHEPSGPVWVFTDSGATQPDIGPEPLVFASSPHDEREPHVILEVRVLAKPGPARYSLEYDDGTPSHARAMVTSTAKDNAGIIDLEIRDREGSYRSAEEARWFAALRLEEQRAPARIEGHTGDLRPALGHRFRLEGCPRPEWNREYLVVRTTLRAEARNLDDEPLHLNSLVTLEAVPVEAALRSSRETAWPQSEGVDGAGSRSAPTGCPPTIRRTGCGHWSRDTRSAGPAQRQPQEPS